MDMLSPVLCGIANNVLTFASKHSKFLDSCIGNYMSAVAGVYDKTRALAETSKIDLSKNPNIVSGLNSLSSKYFI